jgi:N-carbamoylputrescine amidase
MIQTIRLGLIQLSCSDKRSKNIGKTVESIRKAAKKGAQVILLQELFSVPYFCQTVDERYFGWAESLNAPMFFQFSDLARKLEAVICIPFFEYRAAGIYHNSVAVIDADGTLLGSYRKKHIPDDPGFHEKYYFTPGDDGYQVFQTKYVKIGPLICWDQWYPEAARITALKGAELLVFPSAIGTLPDEDEAQKRKYMNAWQTMQRSHAIANGCFAAAANRVGKEGGLNFWGCSFVAGPFGEVICEAGEEEQILITDIDLSRIGEQRREWPFLRDRRIDTYGPILKRYIGNSKSK